MQSKARVLLISGGSWWGEASTNNLGHQFIKRAVRKATAESDQPTTPLKIYICSRKPPPARELDLFVLRNASPNGHTSEEDLTIGNKALDQIKLFHLPLDLASPQSVKKCAEEFLQKEKTLDVLLLNAAIAPTARHVVDMKLYDQPVEEAMMTNVLGHAILIKLLETALKAGDHPRLVTVSSELHRRIAQDVTPETLSTLIGPEQWNGMSTYKITKLIQTYHTFALQDVWADNVQCIAVSPGFVPSTSLSRNSPRLLQMLMSYVMHYAPFASTPEEGGKKIYEASFGDPTDWQHTDAGTAIYLKDYKSVRAAEDVYNTIKRDDWKSWIDRSVKSLLTSTS